MAILSDGTNSMTNSILPMAVTDNFTLMCWVYLETTSESGVFFGIGREGGGTNNGYLLGVAGGGGGIGTSGNQLLMSFNGIGAINSGVNIGTGWHHCAATFKDDNAGRDAIFYIDGVENVFGNATGPSAPTLGWSFCSRLTTSTDATDVVLSAGNRIAHVKVFNKRLSTGEVVSEMNSYRPANRQNLTAWFPIDEGTSTLLSDFSKTYTDIMRVPSGGSMLAWVGGPPVSHN